MHPGCHANSSVANEMVWHTSLFMSSLQFLMTRLWIFSLLSIWWCDLRFLFSEFGLYILAVHLPCISEAWIAEFWTFSFYCVKLLKDLKGQVEGISCWKKWSCIVDSNLIVVNKSFYVKCNWQFWAFVYRVFWYCNIKTIVSCPLVTTIFHVCKNPSNCVNLYVFNQSSCNS